MADEGQQLPDYYGLLGIGFDASDDELRRAWREAVKRWHPDTNRSPDAHRMMASVNEAWEVLGNAQRRAEYDTHYFRMRADMADAERKRQEAERQEWERRERLRQQEMERKRREAEAARQRAEAEARRRAERDRQERERQERARRERERQQREARQKAEQERLRHQERQRAEQDRESRDRERRDRARQRARERRSANGHGAGLHRVRRLANLPALFREAPFWSGVGTGVASSALLALAGAAAIVLIAQQLGSGNSEDGSMMVETAGWGTIWASGNDSVDCTARSNSVRNVAAHGDFPRAEAAFLTPDSQTWSAGFLYHTSDSGFSVAAVRRSGDLSKIVTWTRLNGSSEIGRQEARFRSDLLNSNESNVPNALVMEVTESGTALALNDVALSHVPRQHLIPRQSSVHFCAGFFSDEPSYTLQFVGLSGTIGEESALRGVENRRQHWPPMLSATDIPIIRVTATPSMLNEAVRLTIVESSGPGTIMASPLGAIDCSPVLDGPKNTAAFGETFVAESDFSMPVGTSWSIGFLYHTSESGYSVALVRRRAAEFETVAWTEVGDRTIARQEAPINPDLLRSADADVFNAMRIDASNNGTNLIVNDAVLAHVAPGDQRPYASEVRFCAGFFGDEPTYTVRYSSLRGTDTVTARIPGPTPFVTRVAINPSPTPWPTPTLLPTSTPVPTRHATATPWPTPVPLPTATPRPTARATATPTTSNELTFRGSGRLYSDADDGFIGCPGRTSDPAFISSGATSGSVEFSFYVPDVSSWSIGLLYHHRGWDDDDAATYVYKSSTSSGIRVTHFTRAGGVNVDTTYPVAVASGAFDGTIGATNSVSIQTGQDGTVVRINDRFALSVPVDQLRPRVGAMEVCIGFLSEEHEDYHIRYRNLRAWTE